MATERTDATGEAPRTATELEAKLEAVERADKRQATPFRIAPDREQGYWLWIVASP